MQRPSAEKLLYFSRGDVEACGLRPLDIVAAVEAALQEKRNGTARTAPGLVVKASAQNAFHAKAGVLQHYAALKWFGFFPANSMAGLMDYEPHIILSEATHGRAVAIMDGTWITEMRTAAITAVAAKRFARRKGRIAFIGCGAQARSHLAILRETIGAESVVAFSRRRETAEAFAAHARQSGLDAAASDDARAAVAASDVVISSVPHRLLKAPLLDARWTREGVFASMVDLGHSWHREGMTAFDIAITDDFDQGGGAKGFNLPDKPAADLTQIIAPDFDAAAYAGKRVAFAFSGTALADVAVAQAVFQSALELGIGTRLPL